jgi:hypothetical protein
MLFGGLKAFYIILIHAAVVWAVPKTGIIHLNYSVREVTESSVGL